MKHYPGSRNLLVSFLSDVQDWSVLDKSSMDKALSQMAVPLLGPDPQGILIQDVIKVRAPSPTL